MMLGRRGHVVFAGFAAVVLAIAGCFGAAECAGSQVAGGQQGVCNATDSFAYGGQVAGKSGTETYAWQNTKETARVSWGGQGSSGSVEITITDSRGQVVYQESFSGGQSGSSETTDTGEPGQWSIRVHFDGFTGQMGLSVNAS